MHLAEQFYLDIKKIHIAHQYTLDREHKCAYPKGRGQYGLVYARSGKAEYRFFTGERCTLQPGELLFLSPNNAYSIETQKEFDHYTVNFEIHKESSQLAALERPFCLLQETDTGQIERLFRCLVGIWNEKRGNCEMQAVGHLYELLALFYFDYTQEQSAESYRRLLPAKEYIEQHYQQPITLEQLAFLSNMSVTNFRREWKKWFAKPPMQYRDSIRLYYAKEYLQSGYYTIWEIAEKCGFDDVSYFVRFFKKQTGITPKAYKNR